MPNLNFYYLTQDTHIPVIPDTPPSQSDQFDLITKENIDCITHEENLHFMHASFNDKTMGIYFLPKKALEDFIKYYETKLGVCLKTKLLDDCPEHKRKDISKNEQCPSYQEISSEIGKISNTPVYAYGGSIRDFVKNFSTEGINDFDINYITPHHEVNNYFNEHACNLKKIYNADIGYISIGDLTNVKDHIEGFYQSPDFTSSQFEAKCNSLSLHIPRPDCNLVYIVDPFDSLGIQEARIKRYSGPIYNMDDPDEFNKWITNERAFKIIYRMLKFARRGFNIDNTTFRVIIAKFCENIDRKDKSVEQAHSQIWIQLAMKDADIYFNKDYGILKRLINENREFSVEQRDYYFNTIYKELTSKRIMEEYQDGTVNAVPFFGKLRHHLIDFIDYIYDKFLNNEYIVDLNIKVKGSKVFYLSDVSLDFEDIKRKIKLYLIENIDSKVAEYSAIETTAAEFKRIYIMSPKPEIIYEIMKDISIRLEHRIEFYIDACRNTMNEILKTIHVTLVNQILVKTLDPLFFMRPEEMAEVQEAAAKAEAEAAVKAAAKASETYTSARYLKLDLLYKGIVADNKLTPLTKEYIDNEFPTITPKLTAFVDSVIADEKFKICKIFFLIIYAYLFHNLLCATIDLSSDQTSINNIDNYNHAKSDLHLFVNIIINIAQGITKEAVETRIKTTDDFLMKELTLALNIINTTSEFCVKSANVKEYPQNKKTISEFLHYSSLKKYNEKVINVANAYAPPAILEDRHGNVIRNKHKNIPANSDEDVFLKVILPIKNLLEKQIIDPEIIIRKILKTDINAFINQYFSVVLSNYPTVPNTVSFTVQQQHGGLFRLKRVSRTNKKGGQVSRTNNKKRISKNKNTNTKKNNNKKSRTK